MRSKLGLKLVTLGLLVSSLALYVSGVVGRLSANTTPQTFYVSIQAQEDSPLQIIAANVRSADPHSPRFDFAVVNKGTVPVRAFTVLREISPGNLQAATITHMTSQKDVLQPGQSKTVLVNEGTSGQPVEKILLSVDYVEFTDGSAWGDDAFKSAQRLAGQRAGALAALDHFRQISESKGASALIRSVGEDTIGVPQLQANTDEWKQGFDIGVGVVRQRLQKAAERGGIDEVKSELRKPYDTSGGRP